MKRKLLVAISLLFGIAFGFAACGKENPPEAGGLCANLAARPAQCGQKCRARAMARVPFGQGAVLSDRLPVGVDTMITRRPSISDEAGRSWNDGLRPVAATSPVVESAGRRRQPQWAQKL